MPHYYLTVDVELTALVATLGGLNAALPEGEGVALGDALIKASALAMKAVPDANAAWLGDAIRKYKRCDVNVVIGAGDGLVAPVVRGCGELGLAAIGRATRAHVGAAGAGALGADDLQCGTFTIMNLGAYGIASCAPLRPHAARARSRSAASRSACSPRRAPTPSCRTASRRARPSRDACDHRVIDGAVGAQWLAAFKGFVESPLTMLL